MEEILSSIKRIIAEEGEEAAQKTTPRRGRNSEASASVGEAQSQPEKSGFTPLVDEVLELTDTVEPGAPSEADWQEDFGSKPAMTQPAAEPAAALQGDEPGSILSVESEVAARHSLSALSSMLVTPKDGGDNTLEGLVRAMLKPMLKEWLDSRLPALVEEMVAKEIARITGR